MVGVGYRVIGIVNRDSAAVAADRVHRDVTGSRLCGLDFFASRDATWSSAKLFYLFLSLCVVRLL